MNNIPDRPITAIYRNSDTKSLQDMTIKLLETASLKDYLPGDRNSLIGLKPNLVVARLADTGATTHPEIVEGVILYLQSLGYDNLAIIEGSWVGDKTPAAFRRCGYNLLSDQYNVRLIDTQKDSTIAIDVGGYKLNICSIMQNIDFLINMPVLKGHCQAYYTGALKNLKGCIPNSEKRRYHSMGLHEPIARLNTGITQDFIVMDSICGDPTFEEGGSPSNLQRILCGCDPVLLDSYACTLIHMPADSIDYIGRAAELGVGKLWDGDSSQILEINSNESSAPVIRDDESLAAISGRIDANEACSSCYASLVHALKENPEIGKYDFAIGRAFRGSTSSPKFGRGCIGVGRCTNRFDRSVPGCPPSAEQITQAVLEYPDIARHPGSM